MNFICKDEKLSNIYDYAEFTIQKGSTLWLVVPASIVEGRFILYTSIYILNMGTSIFLVWLKILEPIPSGNASLKWTCSKLKTFIPIWNRTKRYIYRRWKVFRRWVGNNNTIRAWPTARAWRMRLRSFLQAQAAWAVARIVSHSLFSITLIFKCLLYSYIKNKCRRIFCMQLLQQAWNFLAFNYWSEIF